MAILKASSTISNTAATGIASGYGTLKVTISGTEYFISLDKVSHDFTIPAGVSPELIGSSWAITETAATGGTIRTQDGGLPDGNVLVLGGVGKVRIVDPAATNPRADIVFGIDELDLPLILDTTNWEIEQGAVVLTSGTTSTDDVELSFTASSGDTVSGGKGTATLSDGTDSFTIRLNEVNYPFDLASGETLTANGTSFFLV